jgi:acetyl esterase
MQLLAAHSGMAVLGFDYRLGPEHPFPAPLDDMLAVLSFIEDGGLGPVCDPERIAVAGDSAGANLALGAMLHRRDGGGRMPSTAALFYGCYGPVFDTDSHRRLGSGDWLLSTERMRWYWSNFLGQTAADHPIAAPLRADCAGLPPLYLSAAALDPLVDDTTMLAMRLAAAGVRYRLDVWPGVVHGFLRFARELPMANQAIAAAATFVVDVFKQEAK